MFKRLFLPLLLFVVASLASAQLFDSIGGTLKDANLGGTLGGGVAPVDPATPTADLSFTPNGQRLINTELDKLVGTVPDATPEQVEQFKQVIDQLLTAIDAEVERLGENPHDLGTAVAAFFEFAYWSFHNLDPAKEIPDNQSLAAVKQFRTLLSSNPDLINMTNDQRQLFYEAAIGLPALFVAFQQYAADQGDTATADQWRSQVITLFKETSGIDISQVQYTDQGVVVASAGQTPQGQTPQGQTPEQPQTETTQPAPTTTQTTTQLSPEMQAAVDQMTPEELQEMLPPCQQVVANPEMAEQVASEMGTDSAQALALCQAIVAKAGGSTSPTTTPTTTQTPTQPTNNQETNTQQANPLETSNPLGGADPFVGSFSGDNLTLTLQGADNTYTGELNFSGQVFPVQATATGTNLTGTFSSGGNTFNFTATLQDKALTFISDGNTFNLQKQ